MGYILMELVPFSSQTLSWGVVWPLIILILTIVDLYHSIDNIPGIYNQHILRLLNPSMIRITKWKDLSLKNITTAIHYLQQSKTAIGNTTIIWQKNTKGMSH